MSAPTVATAIPVDNRQRAHRLVNCRNQIGSIPVNRNRVSRPGNPSLSQQPDIARELRVPADTLDKITQVTDRVQQEPALDIAALAGEPEIGHPGFRAAVQQRGDAAAGKGSQQPPDRVRPGDRAALVDTALDRVGDLQPHRHRQPAQVEPVRPLVRAGCTGGRPPVRVVNAAA
jgi:hypothetical protein